MARRRERKLWRRELASGWSSRRAGGGAGKGEGGGGMRVLAGSQIFFQCFSPIDQDRRIGGREIGRLHGEMPMAMIASYHQFANQIQRRNEEQRRILLGGRFDRLRAILPQR